MIVVVTALAFFIVVAFLGLVAVTGNIVGGLVMAW